MKTQIKLILGLVFLILTSGSGLLMAKGSEIKFNSLVVSVNQSGDGEGTIVVSVRDIDIPIIVNLDTEIEESGEEIDLEDISAGDFVKVQSFFSDEGLVADEITVLDERSEQFRFRGAITATDSLDDTTIITLMGVDIVLDDSTDITRRASGNGNSVAPSDLVPGDEVNVRGGISDGRLLAARIHVGNREQGIIELEGEIGDVTDTGFSLALDGGGSTTVVLNEDSSVSGEIVAGAFAEVEGQLDADLSLIAFEVVIDVDGDGDADDDNNRAKRGKDNKNNGKGNNNKDNDDDDDGDSSDSDVIKVGAEITLESDDTEVGGKAEYKYVAEGDAVEQEFEIEIEGADAGADFSVVIVFGDVSVELGTITANELGIAEAEFKAGDDDAELDLSAFIPEASDIRDITVVQLLLDGVVILEGEF